jgi:hypothetical protein
MIARIETFYICKITTLVTIVKYIIIWLTITLIKNMVGNIDMIDYLGVERPQSIQIPTDFSLTKMYGEHRIFESEEELDKGNKRAKTGSESEPHGWRFLIFIL